MHMILHVHEFLIFHRYRVSSPPSSPPLLPVELSLAKWWQENIWVSLTSLVWVCVVLSGSSWPTSPSLERARRGRGWCSTSHRDTTSVTPTPCLQVVSQFSFSTHVYKCTCTCIYMYNIHVRVHIHYNSACTHTHVHMYMYIHMYTCTCTCTCIYIHVHSVIVSLWFPLVHMFLHVCAYPTPSN